LPSVQLTDEKVAGCQVVKKAPEERNICRTDQYNRIAVRSKMLNKEVALFRTEWNQITLMSRCSAPFNRVALLITTNIMVLCTF
jgi:hypothetical protein